MRHGRFVLALVGFGSLAAPAAADPPPSPETRALAACSRARAERERARRTRPVEVKLDRGDWRPLLLGERACIPSVVVTGYRPQGLHVLLRRIYLRHRATLEPCERELRRKDRAALEGVVSAWLHVDAEGRVSASKVGGNGPDDEAARCVLGALARWKLTKPDLGARATLRFPLVILRAAEPRTVSPASP
jgi:hypothetical protein